MIAFATELLRCAHSLKDGQQYCWELNPVDPSLVSQYLGVYVHPTSARLIITRNEFGTVESLIAKR